MFNIPLHKYLKQHRRATALKQYEFAELVGIDPKRYGHIERGGRPPNLADRRALIDHVGELRGYVEPPGFARRVADNPKTLMPEAADFYPAQDRPTELRYFAALREHRDFVKRLTATIRQRADFEDCQFLCGQLALESKDEVLKVLRLLEAGALPGMCSPASLQAPPHTIIDPATGQNVGHYRFPCLALPSDFYFFQVTLSIPQNPRVDILRWNNGWSVIEIDGKGHDSKRDEARDRELGIPVTHLTPGVIMADDYQFSRAA